MCAQLQVKKLVFSMGENSRFLNANYHNFLQHHFFFFLSFKFRNLYIIQFFTLIFGLSSRGLRHFPFEKCNQICNQSYVSLGLWPPQASFWKQYLLLPEDSKNLKIVSSYHMIIALISSSVQQTNDALVRTKQSQNHRLS